jgi:hypothetical protein
MPYKRLSRFSAHFTSPKFWQFARKLDFFNRHRRLHSQLTRPRPTPHAHTSPPAATSRKYAHPGSAQAQGCRNFPPLYSYPLFAIDGVVHFGKNCRPPLQQIWGQGPGRAEFVSGRAGGQGSNECNRFTSADDGELRGHIVRGPR